jgi:hypothetical protein
MSECTDYWCDDYGKANGKCGRCEKKDCVKNKSDLRMIFINQADKHTGFDNNQNKNKNKGRQR